MAKSGKRVVSEMIIDGALTVGSVDVQFGCITVEERGGPVTLCVSEPIDSEEVLGRLFQVSGYRPYEGADGDLVDDAIGKRHAESPSRQNEQARTIDELVTINQKQAGELNAVRAQLAAGGGAGNSEALTKAQGRVAELERANSDLKGQLDTANSDRDALRGQASEAVRKVDELEKNLGTASAEREQLRKDAVQQVADLGTEVGALRTRVAELEKENAELKKAAKSRGGGQ